MQVAVTLANEAERLAALARYAILDTAPEDAFDEVAQLASLLCGTPIALVSLVDDQRQWFKARVGLDAPETPRDIAFCTHAMLEDGLFEVEDATADARFSDNPLVVGDPRIRFYAGAPLVNPDGLVLGTLCVIDRKPRQLTDLQRTSLQVLGRQVIAQLELRQRVRELSEVGSLLVAARDQALAGLRSKDIFLANMGHELRTPLNAILGLSEMMLEHVAEAEDRSDLGVIHRAGQHLLAVVEDILGYAQLELDQPQLRLAEVDLCEVLAEIEALMRAQWRSPRVSLRFALPGRAPAFTDVTKVRQIALNLLTNAVKFTETGRVDVSLEPGADGWLLHVRDTGIGIAADKVPLLFADFHQVHDTRKSEYRGSGLGLAISRRYARLLGGDIDVVSEPGRGSAFTVRLAARVAAPSP